jgi:hypothetical protein
MVKMVPLQKATLKGSTLIFRRMMVIISNNHPWFLLVNDFWLMKGS